jgi:hypothetical protein
VWEKSQGGLDSEKDRSLCKDMLGALLGELAADDFDVCLLLDDGINLTWPAPLPGQAIVRLPVTGGLVDMMPLQRIGHTSGLAHPLASRLQVGRELVSETLLDFYLRCVHSRGQYSHILPQVAWALGLRLDQLISASSSELSCLSVRDITMDAFDATHPRDVDQALVQYWQSGLKLASNAKDISIATDKTRGNSRGLCNAALVLPSNEAIWLITQARGEQNCHPPPPRSGHPYTPT